MDRYKLMPAESGWTFKKEGSDRAIRNFESKDEAIDFCREYMQSREGSLIIYKKDGEIQEERTFPRAIDPSRSPG